MAEGALPEREAPDILSECHPLAAALLAGHAYHAGHACLADVEYTVTLVNT